MRRAVSPRPQTSVDGLTPELEALLTLLALLGESGTPRIARLASATDLRDKAGRQHDRQSLRARLQQLVDLGLVVADSMSYACVRGLDQQLLREARRNGRLQGLVAAVERADYSLGSYYGPGPHLELLARAALAEGSEKLEPLVRELVALTSVGEVVEAVIAPGFDAFDAAWFEALPAAFRDQWTGLALGRIEAEGLESAALTQYFGEHLQAAAVPDRLLPLAGIAIARGDRALLEKFLQTATGETRAAISAAAAVVDGRHAEAAESVPAPRKGPLPHGMGLVAVLNALALLMRTRPADLELARKLLAAGSRKGLPMRDSFRELKDLAALVTLPAGDSPPTSTVGYLDPADSVAPLLRLLRTVWFHPSPRDAKYTVLTAVSLSTRYGARGLVWLKAQAEHLAEHLAEALDHRAREGAPRATIQQARPELPSVPPLLALRAEKAAWELALDGLERFAEKSSPTERAGTGPEERLLWRVSLEDQRLSPYLQKRTANGYTKGRELAPKQLLPGGALHSRLPPEDARIAGFARDDRASYRGWTHAHQYFEPQAFLALVGHPRVYLEGSDTPVDVVRGQVQLVVQRHGDELRVQVEPAELEGNLKLVSDGRRLTVYLVEGSAEPLLKWLGTGLTLPATAQPRALSVLGRLSHVLPIQSFEATDARRVAADPTPWLRIQPRGAGLAIALSVRPLGAAGPQSKPGQGAPTLLGHVENQFVQADRDLNEEKRLTQQLLDACEALRANEIGDYAYELSEPSDCLELVSSLRKLEPSVHVEWPLGKPLRLRASVSRKSLRGGIRRAGDFFLATGSLEVDSELTLDLEELLRLSAESSGRFLRLENGDYLEIERELRETLEALTTAESASTRAAKAGLRGVALGKSAVSSLEELFAHGSPFSLDKGSKEFRDRLSAAFAKKPKLPRTLQAELRPYQEEGFVWLARLSELELGACLADDMGLGKTVQILALLLSRVKAGPALVVAPVSVCDNWRSEIARFAPSLEVRWYLGPGREGELDGLGSGQVVITSYALLQQDIERLQTIEFGTAVLDEAQFIKNADSLRARAACALTARMRVAATGTPVENHVGDLFGIFQFLMPELLGTRSGFNKRFPLASEGEVGATARRRLRRLIQPFVLRRTKSQVLSELPELTEIRRTVTLTPEEAALYESLRRAAIAKLSEAGSAGNDPRDRFQVLAEITRLRRLCCHPNLAMPEPKLESSKLAAFLEIVDELVEGRHRALVFSQFVDMLQLVREALDARGVSYQYLDGKTSHAQRKVAVNAFQAGEGDLFLISLRAGGFGLNLTGADYVIHLDPWWNPAVEAQASDRAHRIGQTRPVTVYRLVTAKTVEDRIIDLHRTKRELADTLLEDTDAAAKLGAEELRALLDS